MAHQLGEIRVSGGDLTDPADRFLLVLDQTFDRFGDQALAVITRQETDFAVQGALEEIRVGSLHVLQLVPR